MRAQCLASGAQILRIVAPGGWITISALFVCITERYPMHNYPMGESAHKALLGSRTCTPLL